MASNFKIMTDRKEDRIYLKLYGDFDGSSAHELINHLRKYGREASKINIHTQGLNDVNPFGLNIFNRSPMNKNNYGDRIAFSGDKATFFVRPRANLSL
jgi:hypothetical protein